MPGVEDRDQFARLRRADPASFDVRLPAVVPLFSTHHRRLEQTIGSLAERDGGFRGEPHVLLSEQKTTDLATAPIHL